MAGTRDITLLQILWPKIHFCVSSGFGDEAEKEECVSASRECVDGVAFVVMEGTTSEKDNKP